MSEKTEAKLSGAKRNDPAEDYLLSTLGVNRKAVQKNLDMFYDRIGDMESDNKLDAVNPTSSAKGVYQFLNANGKKGDNFIGSSFYTALNRVARAYAGAKQGVPDWVKEAYQHADPTRLSREQSNVLMLADLTLRPERTTPYLSRILVDGDKQALADLYARFHHTDVNDPSQGKVVERMKEKFGVGPSQAIYE